MDQNHNGRLGSWKEIADYLDKDVRTVVRWEKERGLPVHRMPGSKRSAVFAVTAEIDEWQRNGNGASIPEPAEGAARRPGRPAVSPGNEEGLAEPDRNAAD